MSVIVRLLVLGLALPAGTLLAAEVSDPATEVTMPPAPAGPPLEPMFGEVPPAIDPWTLSGRLGAYIANVTTSNAETSRDPTIATTTASTSFLFTYEGQANWRSDKDSIDHLLKARYGRIRTAGQDWLENNDEIRYDGVYRRTLWRPHFVYLGWGAESVFTGPDPYGYAFDPTTGKASGGYGQRYEDFLPDKNHLELRLGARAQQKWGASVTTDEGRIETGIEGFVRYEHVLKRGDGDYDVRFFAQYEGFCEFNDLGHLTHLVTTGLTAQVTRYLAVELGLRAYQETTPEEDDGTGTGYDEWSMRQDWLFGLTYAY